MSAAADCLKAALNLTLDDLVRQKLEPVEVCVIDSGIDASHPDLAGRVVDAYRVHTIPASKERHLSDTVAVETVETPANNDLYGHGTGVASIICRIAPHVTIVDIGVLGADNRGSALATLKGLEMAVERKSRLINMSLASTKKIGKSLFLLCEKAYRQNQIIVAAKRNALFPDLGYPALFSNVISVDNYRFPSAFIYKYFANEIIEYGAHGEEVVMAAPSGGYTVSSGTSFATPAVCGICALLVGAFPSLRPFEVKTLLKAFADEQFPLEID